MKVRLEVSHKSGKKKIVNIHSDAVIGRSTECSLRIASSEISRKHCKLTVIESGVLVRDLESANGTWINGKMIPPARDVALPPGSRLSIGPVQFLVHYESSNPAIDPPGSTVELPAVQAFADAATPPAPAAVVADEPTPDELQIEQNEPTDVAEDDSEAVATVVVQPEEAQQAIADALAGRVAEIEGESAEDVMDVEEVEDAEIDEEDAAEDVVGVVGTEIEEPAAEPIEPEPSAPPSKGKLGGMLGGLLKFGRKAKTKTTAEEPVTPAVDATEDAADVADVEEADAAAANDEAPPQIAPPAEPDLEPEEEYEDEGEEGYYEDGEEYEEEYEEEEEVDAELGDFFNQFEDK